MNNFATTGAALGTMPESADQAQSLFQSKNNNQNQPQKVGSSFVNKKRINEKKSLVEDPLGLLSENEDFGSKTDQKLREITICLE